MLIGLDNSNSKVMEEGWGFGVFIIFLS